MDSDNKSAGMTRRQFVASSTAALALTRLLHGEQSTSIAPQSKQSARPPFRVILDTDPGVDDAFALLLAMRSPELKIEGITPVAGNVPLDLGLPNALRMVEIAGRTDIPVAAGARAPLLRRLITAVYAHGDNGLAGAVFPEPKLKPFGEHATDFIQKTVRKYPGEVTLIAIGPLTNIATALNSDQELAPMVRSLVVMGGSLSGGNITPAAEFNIYVDPEAARVVFHSGIPITMVGLDVTRKTSLTSEHLRALEAGKSVVSQAAATIARKAIEQHREAGFPAGPNMHDPLAVAAFLDPSLLTWKDYYVDVETTGELTAGETVGYTLRTEKAPGIQVRGSPPTLAGSESPSIFHDKVAPNARVAVDVDSARFFDLLISRLSGNQ
jgi:purine nucleosidase